MYSGILLFFGFACRAILASNDNQCGQTPVPPSISVNIVGGTTATPGSWPWQVLVWNSFTGTVCGGSIIASDWILTAGHCVDGYVNNPGYFNVYAGASNISDLPKAIHVKKVHIHPNYGHLSNSIVKHVPENDIALLQLSTPLTYSNSILPVCLPSTNDTLPNSAVATGWGVTYSGSDDISKTLRQVRLPIVNIDSCAERYGDVLIKNMVLCAGQNGKDTCQGDSGGPLVAQRSDGSWYQLGVTSWGIGCGSVDPGVYASVSHFHDFISDTTKSNGTYATFSLMTAALYLIFVFFVSI